MEAVLDIIGFLGAILDTIWRSIGWEGAALLLGVLLLAGLPFRSKAADTTRLKPPPGEAEAQVDSWWFGV